MTGEWSEMTGSPILAPGCYESRCVGSNSLRFKELHGCVGSAEPQPLGGRLGHLVELERAGVAAAERIDCPQGQERERQHDRERRGSAGAKCRELDVRELIAEEH